MKNTNNIPWQNSIYIPYEHDRVAVSKELHAAYYKGLDALRRYKNSLGECACREGEYFKCDGNCERCGFRRGKNGTMDWIRGEKEESQLEEDEMVDTTQDVAAIVERKACYEHLYRAMTLLPDREREIAEKISHGKTIAQIARDLGIAKSTARYRYMKVLEKLRKELKEWY